MVKKNFKKKVNVFKGESNPFNMKINREKRCILGQKVKGTKGLRGISRAESHAKRKELWHKTKVSVEKANTFLDKRLMDGSLQPEENAVNRLVQERKKKLKKNIFNLNEENLTHQGMPLDVAKAFNGKESVSDDEEQLDAAFVNQAHFGGFTSDYKTQESKSHKEIIDELIVESKKKKQEKKMEKEINEDLTENLDKGWKEFLSIASGIKMGPSNVVPEKNDPYNIIARELKFEKRGAPTSRSKTEEEIEREEQERMQKLEAERRIRMVDDMEYKAKKANDHLSADSIYDDFDLQPVPVEENINEVSSPQVESDYSDSEESVNSQESEKSTELVNEVESDEELKDDEKEILAESSIKVSSNIPESMEEFEEFISTHNLAPEDLCNAVEEILRPTLKSKSEKMLKKLAEFFGVLVEYALKCLNSSTFISEDIAPHLYAITEVSPLNTAEKLLSFLDREQKIFQKRKGLKKKVNSPSLECILILKYCSVLYSVSDFQHPVITPTIIFMCDILSSTFPVTFPNITSRLFVCRIIADCVSQSKRVVPEAICFLNKVLSLAVPDKKTTTSKETKIDIVVSKKSTSKEIEDLNLFNLNDSTSDDSKKLIIICQSVSLLHQFAILYTHLPSYLELFSETSMICSKLPTGNYTANLKDSICNLAQQIKERTNVLFPLLYQNTKPKPLKMFEPSFESKFDKKDNINKKFKLLKRVSQKIRKEEKGVLREMRRDVQMISGEKLSERLESDAERKRKVKELYHELSMQEGEYKKLMKKKS